MKFFLVFAISVLFCVEGQAAKGGKLGYSTASGHGSTGGGSSSRGRTMHQDPRHTPPLEERRKVNEQDCSRPVDLSAGNLRCK